jgi:two-component system, OmpR family, lantibiotic biosynthesis response regulator NisR/SpaR
MEDGKKPLIFIIDDDSFLLDLYAIKFNQVGYEIMSTPDPESALAKLRDGVNPDILLLDIVMPHMTGFELLETMSKENLAPFVVTIFLTNTSDKSDIEKGKALGDAGYIVKANNTPTEVVTQVIDIYKKSRGEA